MTWMVLRSLIRTRRSAHLWRWHERQLRPLRVSIVVFVWKLYETLTMTVGKM